MITHGVTFAVLDAVHAFGAKVTGEDDPFFNICHNQAYISKREDEANSEAHILGKLDNAVS